MVCQSHETGTEKEDESLSDSKALFFVSESWECDCSARLLLS